MKYIHADWAITLSRGGACQYVPTRLARMLPDLDREFGQTHAAEEIRACADAILAGYDHVPVRSIVQTIAYREARECLRADRCAAMTTA